MNSDTTEETRSSQREYQLAGFVVGLLLGLAVVVPLAIAFS